MNPTLNALLSCGANPAVCWLGNLSWLIAWDGRLIAFDLDLNSPERLAASPVSASELAPFLEAMFITHEHGDHFNDLTGQILARQSKCLFVVPANCVDKARSIGLPPRRVKVARPREAFDLSGLHVEPLRAIHGDRRLAVYGCANLDDCGYVLTVGGMRFLQPGDSLLSQDHLSLKDIDAIFVSPTEHNMLVEPAARLVHSLRPRYVFPQHFDTYIQTPDNAFWTRGYADELAGTLDLEMAGRYHKLRQGEVFTLQSR